MTIDPKTLSKTPTPDLVAQLRELTANEAADRLIMFGRWRDAGAVLIELRERHLKGDLGTKSWAQYCHKLGVLKVDAELYIAASQADNPAEFIDEVFRIRDRRAEQDAARRGPRTIIIRRPGVVFGYLTELTEGARREFWALCWRNYAREMRRAGDMIGITGDEEERRPSPS
jgi:hypothetical protein